MICKWWYGIVNDVRTYSSEFDSSATRTTHSAVRIHYTWYLCRSASFIKPYYIAWPLALWLHILGQKRALVFRLWLASLNLIRFGGVAWRLQSHWPIVFRDSPTYFSNFQYKQVRLVMRIFLKRCFNHLVWHKMFLSYKLKIVQMKLYYNCIYYHSHAYDFFVFIIISLYLAPCSRPTFISAQKCT